MFVDWKSAPPPPPEPRRSGRRRDETVLLWIVGLNLLAVFLSPIAGGTVFHAVAAVLGY